MESKPDLFEMKMKASEASLPCFWRHGTETVVLRIIASSHNSVFERESDISTRPNGLPQIILHAF